MASSKNKVTATIVLTVVVYIIHLVFNGLASRGATNLFPRSVGDASDVFKLEMTPVGATFSIWGIIFAYQIIWLIYAVSTIFRQGDHTEILSTKFYMGFMTNIIFVVIWLFVWTRLEAAPSFIVIMIAQVFIDLAIALACSELTAYQETHELNSSNKVDIWCQRILVQNGLLFYGTWTTVATLINTAVVFAYELEATTEKSSLIALSFLGILSIIWFVLENFVLCRFTGYTFTPYIALIYALSGIFAARGKPNDPVGGLTLGLLILSIVLFIVRIVLIFLNHRKRASYDSIGYNARSEAVRS